MGRAEIGRVRPGVWEREAREEGGKGPRGCPGTEQGEELGRARESQGAERRIEWRLAHGGWDASDGRRKDGVG